MDLNAVDVGEAIAVLVAVFKAFRSDAKADEIKADRKTTKEGLDVWKREVEITLKRHDESFKAGEERFDKTDRKMDQLNQKMDEANSKIDRLMGFISAALGKREIE